MKKIIIILLFIFSFVAFSESIPLTKFWGIQADSLHIRGHTSLDSSLSVGTDLDVGGVVVFDSLVTVEDLQIDNDLDVSGDAAIDGTCEITGKATANWIEADSLTAQRTIINKSTQDTLNVGGGTNIIKINTFTAKPAVGSSGIWEVGGGFDPNSLMFVNIICDSIVTYSQKITSSGTLQIYVPVADTAEVNDGLGQFFFIDL